MRRRSPYALRTPSARDDDVAQARPGRDEELLRLAALLGPLVGEQSFVSLDARPRLRVPRPRRHPHPLELALERAALGRLLLLLDRQPLLLLGEPARVVPLPRNARAAVEFQDPARDVVQEVAVVGDRDDGAGVFRQVPLEPGDGLGVEMIGRLVQEKQVGPLEQDLAERDAALLAARESSTRRRRGGGSRSASIAISSCRSSSQAFDASIASWTFWYSAMSFSLSASESSPAIFSFNSSNRFKKPRVFATASSTLPRTSLDGVEPRVLRRGTRSGSLRPGAPRRRSPCPRPP